VELGKYRKQHQPEDDVGRDGNDQLHDARAYAQLERVRK
jgi:hypothetical protein